MFPCLNLVTVVQVNRARHRTCVNRHYMYIYHNLQDHLSCIAKSRLIYIPQHLSCIPVYQAYVVFFLQDVGKANKQHDKNLKNFASRSKFLGITLAAANLLILYPGIPEVRCPRKHHIATIIVPSTFTSNKNSLAPFYLSLWSSFPNSQSSLQNISLAPTLLAVSTEFSFSFASSAAVPL